MNEVFELPDNLFSENPTNAAQNSVELARFMRLYQRIKLRPKPMPIAAPVFLDRRGTELIAPLGFEFRGTVPRCAVVVRAENCTLERVRNVGMPGQTRPLQAIAYDSGFVFEPAARNTRAIGCESANQANGGFLNFGSQHLFMDMCKSIDTGADGVHHTFGAGWAEVNRHVCIRTGDDFYSTVSHANEAMTHHILVRNSEGYDQRWGRGATVIGGEHIKYEGLRLYRCSGFGVNINSEDSYNTHGVNHVELSDITIDGTGVGQPTPIDWVGVLVGGRAAGWVRNVSTKNIIVRNSVGPTKRHVAAFTQNIDLSGVND